MFMKTILLKMRGVTASLVSVLAFATPAQSLTFTTFTNETDFRSAAGSLSTETFNSFTADASFNNGVTVNLADFSLTGFGNSTDFGSRNLIDVSPFAASIVNINGTPFVLGITQSGIGFNTTFNSPITAFGATFNGTSDFAPNRLRVGNDVVGNLPVIFQGGNGFFGFIANGSFATLTFDIPTGAGADAFGADNFLYSSSATPVPFEFSPALGVGALGGLLTAKRLIKKSKNN